MKYCTKCKIEKPLELFSKSKAIKCGYTSVCKKCKLQHYYDNKEQYRLRDKNRKSEKAEYYLKNRHWINERNKQYNKDNRHKERLYIGKRRKKEPLFKLSLNIRRRLNIVLKSKNWTKINTFKNYIGCTLEQLKVHIESQWKPGMNWDNWSLSGWHIDHIIPLSSARTEEEMYKLCYYTNLQPLWAKENLDKRKIEGTLRVA